MNRLIAFFLEEFYSLTFSVFIIFIAFTSFYGAYVILTEYNLSLFLLSLIMSSISVLFLLSRKLFMNRTRTILEQATQHKHTSFAEYDVFNVLDLLAIAFVLFLSIVGVAYVYPDTNIIIPTIITLMLICMTYFIIIKYKKTLFIIWLLLFLFLMMIQLKSNAVPIYFVILNLIPLSIGIAIELFSRNKNIHNRQIND